MIVKKKQVYNSYNSSELTEMIVLGTELKKKNLNLLSGSI